jgi:hypothetical protein
VFAFFTPYRYDVRLGYTVTASMLFCKSKIQGAAAEDRFSRVVMQMHEGHDTHEGTALSEERVGEPNCTLMRNEKMDYFELGLGAHTGGKG